MILCWRCVKNVMFHARLVREEGSMSVKPASKIIINLKMEDVSNIALSIFSTKINKKIFVKNVSSKVV